MLCKVKMVKLTQEVLCCWNCLPKTETDNRTVGPVLKILVCLFALHYDQEQFFCKTWLLKLFIVWPQSDLQLDLNTIGLSVNLCHNKFIIILIIHVEGWAPLHMLFSVPKSSIFLYFSVCLLFPLQYRVAMLPYSVRVFPSFLSHN